VQHSPAIHHTIVAVDMADFTNPARTDQHRVAMREGLDEVLKTAFDSAGVHWESCYNEDRGDGKMILVPADIPKSMMFEQLPNLLLTGLIRHNALYAREAHIQLRVAVHAGEVATDASGKVGTALNDTFRIVDAEPVKADLRDSSGVLAIVVSETIFGDVIKPDPANEPAKFKQIPVNVKRTNTTAWLRIFGTVEEQSRVIPVFKEAPLTQLHELLGELALPELPLLRARVVGRGVPPMGRRATAWEIVQDLLDRNAEPGGFPRVLTFVELVARQVEGTLGDSLRRWNDAQALHLRQLDTLGRLRAETAAPVTVDHCLHLVIVIEHDMFDRDHYVISHWRQDDPGEWPPARGEPRVAAFTDLERVIDELVMSAEVAWSAHEGDVALEFVLPRTLLNLPVDSWFRELRSGDPSPLVLHYPVVIRSLERMLTPHWLRVWRAKWRVLIGPPPGGSVYIARRADADHPYRIAAALQDPQVVSMVLTKAPGPEVGPNDELGAALRAGVPVVLWCRADSDANALYDVVGQLAEHGTLDDLPQRVHVARRDALVSPDQQKHPDVVKNLVILWDNPVRPVYLDQPPNPARLEVDTADEREPAS
jgi:hypothetical protein